MSEQEQQYVWVYLFDDGYIRGIFSSSELAFSSIQYAADLAAKYRETPFDKAVVKRLPVDHEWVLPNPERPPIESPIPVCWTCRLSPSGDPEFSFRLWPPDKPIPEAKPDHGRNGGMLYILEGWAPCFVLGYGPDQASAEASARELWQALADRRSEQMAKAGIVYESEAVDGSDGL